MLASQGAGFVASNTNFGSSDQQICITQNACPYQGCAEHWCQQAYEMSEDKREAHAQTIAYWQSDSEQTYEAESKI
jgi:hypothetical protein